MPSYILKSSKDNLVSPDMKGY